MLTDAKLCLPLNLENSTKREHVTLIINHFYEKTTRSNLYLLFLKRGSQFQGNFPFFSLLRICGKVRMSAKTFLTTVKYFKKIFNKPYWVALWAFFLLITDGLLARRGKYYSQQEHANFLNGVTVEHGCVPQIIWKECTCSPSATTSCLCFFPQRRQNLLGGRQNVASR